MFCRIAMGISPPWLAPRDRRERVTLRVTLSGGANVTAAIPAEVYDAASTSGLQIGDQPSRKATPEWRLRDRDWPGARQNGRRFVPPEELRIVPQPRRERPPIWPRRLTLRRDRGGRSRLGCLPRFPIGLGSRFAAANAPELRPRTRRSFTARSAGWHVRKVQPGWGVRWL